VSGPEELIVGLLDKWMTERLTRAIIHSSKNPLIHLSLRALVSGDGRIRMLIDERVDLVLHARELLRHLIAVITLSSILPRVTGIVSAAWAQLLKILHQRLRQSCAWLNSLCVSVWLLISETSCCRLRKFVHDSNALIAAKSNFRSGVRPRSSRRAAAVSAALMPFCTIGASARFREIRRRLHHARHVRRQLIRDDRGRHLAGGGVGLRGDRDGIRRDHRHEIGGGRRELLDGARLREPHLSCAHAVKPHRHVTLESAEDGERFCPARLTRVAILISSAHLSTARKEKKLTVIF